MSEKHAVLQILYNYQLCRFGRKCSKIGKDLRLGQLALQVTPLLPQLLCLAPSQTKLQHQFLVLALGEFLKFSVIHWSESPRS